MTYIEPTPPGTPEPEIQPPSTPAPEVEPSAAPEEMPPLQPGWGDPDDSRPFGER